MSITSKTMSLSKEMSVEESYSKTSCISTSSVMSSALQSSSTLQSSSLMSSAMGDIDDKMSALVSKIDTDMAIMDSDKDLMSGLKMSSMEKSSSVVESDSSLLSKKFESMSSVDIQESSKTMSMSSVKEEVSMSKSETKSLTKSESVSSEISEEKPCIYVAVMDYTPRSGDSDGLELSEGQEVEVIDSSRAHKWRVRLRKDGREGTVASCYLEKREISTPVMSPQLDAKAQATKARREKIMKELVESEEAFSRDMQYVVDNYIRELELKTTPKELRDCKEVLFSNFKAISEFHNNVLMKGIQYYADDPARLGKTFLRLERDFDKHVEYCRDEPEAQLAIQSNPLKDYFEKFSKKLDDDKSLSEHLKLPIQRISDYQLLLKELIKYTTRLREDTTDLEKAHDFMQAIPQRIADLQYLNSIQGYKGNLHKLGRILKHDWFDVTDCNNLRRERFLFLFKSRIFVTDQKRLGTGSRFIYLVKNIIKLPETEIVDCADDDDLKLRFQSLKNTPGFPLTIKSKTMEVKEEWLGAIQVASGPTVEDLGDDELDLIEDTAAKVEEFYEKHETKVEIVEDFEAYEEMHTMVTESVRSGSLTSLEDFQSALDDEPSLCLTASDVTETAAPGRPRFAVPLKAHTCPEGVEAILECEVCATGDVTVAWLKDNSPLASSKRALLEADGGKHRLLIKKAECVDSGLYTIIASNVHGTTSCSAPLTVSSAPGAIPPTKPDGTPMAYGPIFREKLRDTQLQTGTDFRVCIIVEGEPRSTLRFFKNEEEIGTEGRVRYNKENDDCYELIIDNVNKEDAAKYSCIAKSTAGQNVTACDITVTRPQVFVKFADELDKTSTPDIVDNIQWNKDSKEVEVESSEHFECTTGEQTDTVSLKFKHVTPDDSGIYTCVASTTSGKISCSAELTVQGSLLRDPESPKLKALSKTVDAKQGSSALLELTATGFPQPVITWSKDGEELKLGDKFVMLQEDDETFTMAIKDVSQGDSGKYKAEAINDMGKDEVTYDVRVTSPPKFTKQMKGSNVMVGEDIEFSVEIDGSPEPTVSWCKDGQQLSPSDRVIISSDGKVKKLVIKNARVEDAGNYSCIIKNDNGSQGGFGAVQVNAPPKFVKGLNDATVNAGENVEFAVNISGNPVPSLKWLKDGQEVKLDGSRISQRKKGDTLYVLTIKETTKDDIGEYTCEIVNEYGKETSKGALKLKEKLAFKKGLKDIQVSEGEDIELKVNITGDPKPSFKWSKDGSDLTIDGEHVLLKKEEADDSCTVIVRNCTTEDSGSYKCTITNSESTETTTSKVTVKEEVTAPSFKKELKDITVIEGETVELSVKFSGKPKVKWSKDGAELKIDNKHFEYKKEEAEDSLTLVIHDAKQEDTGKYTCTITNSAGSASSSSNISVKEDVKTPVFTKELKDVTVTEGETVEFSVKYSGKAKSKWTKDGEELTIDGKHYDFEYKKEEAEDSLTLVLHNARPEDAGKYTCTLTNSAGSASSSSKVIVSADEKAPTFQKGLKDMTVKENETVNYTVKFTGKPKPKVKWDKDGAELKIDTKHVEQKYEEAEDSLTLILKNVSKDDAGQYTCTITNSAGSEETSSKLQVTETEKSASFKKKLNNLSVIEEESVELAVEYDGNPKPTLKWQKDGKDIVIDDDHYEVTKKDNTEVLTINDVTKEDSGEYTCVVTNSSGSEKTTSTVTVKESTNSPKFVKGLKDQNAKEEQTVKFTVKFTGKPKPKAKWTKDDAELTIDGKHTKLIEEAEDSLTIVIENAKINDSGKYSCTITNSEGSDTTTSKLTVTESTSAPEFTQKLKDKDVKEGQDAQFTVKFTGKPKPTAKWTLDSADLTIDGAHTELRTEEDGASLTLILHGATKEDAGKYACTATNEHGSQTTSAKLTVSVAPQFVKGLEDVEAEEGATLRMNVKFEGQPDPTVVWKLNGKTLEIDGKRVKVSIEGDDSLTLIVDKLKKEDVGKYSCEITNAQGKDTTAGNVTVTGKPVIKKALEDKEVTEGDTNVELIVEANATPAPTIKWYLNGTELASGDSYDVISDESKGIYKLILKKVTSSMIGEVRFEVTNPSGKAECKGKVSLLKKPVFLKQMSDITICEGDSLKFETSCDGSPKPEIKWLKGKKELDSSVCKLSKDSSAASLEIEEASVEDSGTYICKAKNKVGEVTQQATVTVKSRKDTQAPTFITHLYDQVIVVDDAGRLEVKVTGKPNPDVKWYRNGEELQPNERVIIKSDSDSNTHTVTLKDLKIEDTAKFTCKATNKYGDAEEHAQITIKAPTLPLIEDLESLEVSYGAPARIKAKVTGFPKPDVKWFKEESETPLKSDECYEISADSETKRHMVTVKSVKVDQVGIYRCQASNQAGEMEVECELTIKAQAPVFVRDLKEQSVDLGEQFKFEAEVHGYPAPEITWFKDNKPVESHLTASKSGDVYKLEGTAKSVEDAGTFTCKAKNPAGEDSRKSTLKISDFAPKFTEKLPSSIDLVEGEPLNLKAKVSGKPVPEIKWVKDGKPLRPSSHLTMKVSPDGTAELSVQNMTHEDAGVYKVVAENEKGQAATESSVGVAFKAKTTKPFVGQLHAVEAVVGKPIVLEAKVNGNPQPKIEWSKDGTVLSSGPHVKLTEADNKAVLTIDSAQLDDAGEYKLTASNDQGEDSSSAAVSVTAPGKKPTIVKELKAGKLLEGDEGKLQVVVSGQPMPSVAWIHNGRNVIEGEHCVAAMDENGLATLTFHKVKSEDGGMYTAIATNKLGKAVSEAPINVVPATIVDIKHKPTKVFEFLQSLMPQLVTEGKTGCLEAKVTTDPKPVSVKWLKDGKELSPSEHIRIVQEPDGTLKLTIDHMGPGDRGRYAVVVSDGETEIKSEAMVNMNPSMPGMSGNKPYFIKGLEPIKVAEGETIKLQAQLPPDSGCAIKWMKDGDDVAKNERTSILEQPNGTIALVIEAATPEDCGKYVVIATNDEGKTRSSAQVAVVGSGFKLPEIVDSLQPTSFVQGQPGKLTAKIDGEPKPEVKWLKDGLPIEQNGRVKTTRNPDGTVSLEISEVRPEDAGKYTLLVSNVGGEMRSSANVDVIQSPMFSKYLEPVTGVVDCPVKLECKVSGDPLPEIKWTKDGQEVSDDDPNIRKCQLPSGEVALVLGKCRPEDAGNYTCTASNKHGDKSCSAPLNVIGKEVEGQQKNSPAFTSPLNDLSVQEGENFRLEATVSGNPLPDVKWFLDDQPLSMSDTILPTFDGKKATLKVYRCNPRHEGVYECRVSNTLGEASSKGKVTVQAHTPPKFIERLSDMQFTTNTPMKLVCRVTGVPKPTVDWYFNRNKLDSGIKYSILKEGDKCVLTVPHPRIADSGLYECRAKNEVGRDSCNANIAVSAADTEGEPAMFLKKLKDTTVLNGMSAKLTACICGTPKPEVKWFKDGAQLTADNRVTLEADPNGVIRLIIRGAQKSDSGTYRVSIANKFGSDTCTATLGIEGEDKRKPAEVVKKEPQKLPATGPPSPLAHAPYIFKMTDTTASLGWRPAIPTHPQVPYTYRLEVCKTPDGQWSTYKSGIKDSSCDIRDLVPNTDYMFRVRVENRYGASDPSPYVTAHRTSLQRHLSPADFAPKDFDLDHLKLDKYAAAPRFLRLEEDSAYAIRGHPARVEYWVYGCPQPKLSWFFNNQPVESGKYDFLEDRNGQAILFITRMGDDDVGTYTCKAVNEHGEAQRKIKLMIAEHPIFTKRLEPQTTLIRKSAEFRCRVVGVPLPKIKWFKDWHPLSESSRIHIKFEEPDTCVLTLNDAILKDGGLYTCTATNVAGTATTSAMLSVEECENEYHILTYQRPPFSKPSDRPFEDFYDIGEELGRGTQGITYHVVERKSGRSLAAKVMHGEGKLMDFMTSEMDVMNQLCHPRLVRLWNAHSTKSSLTLATDLCGGGELFPNIIHQDRLTESVVAHYIKQILEGLQHMHEKNIAHLGLTIGDVLLTRLNCDNIKIGDFSLATRLHQGREFVQEYGHPEFVAPEIANKLPVTLAADMWSVGIIAYILLVGESPFLRENDRATLHEVQKGKPDFYHEGFAELSDDARDFVTLLLQFDPSQRMDVNAALKHKWIGLDSIPDKCDELNNIDRLRNYHKRWRSWYANASCRWFFRRRPLESCFTHPSRMIYPPGEEYTPPATPDRECPERSRVKPAAFDDVTFRQRIEREAIDPKSESHYQNGPDTFLLPLRDPDFPVRIRRYLKVGAGRSPMLASHLKDKHWGYSDVAVKERRKFVDVMDEEIDDEKKGLSRSAALRQRHEVGTVGSGYDHIESKSQKKRRGFRGSAGSAPFFREKIKAAVVRENEDAEFQCRVTADPEAQISWFRNDGILIESSRIIINKWSDGRCSLTLRPAKAYDVGSYKCVARNIHGVSTCRARLNLGCPSAKPDPPKAEKCSDTEIFLTWMPPKFDGYSPTFGYALEYKEEGAEAWTKLANNIGPEFYLVRNLTPATTYHFRLCALNKFGWSEFSVQSDPILTLAEASPKIELGRAEKFQQDQTDSGQELLLDTLEQVKLDYDREDEPLTLQEAEPTELYNYISEISKGRFSVVMKVWHKKVNTAFVAKALDLSGANAQAAHREFEIYSSLQHERIANLYSASESKTSMFFIVEKLSGIDVISYLSMRPLYTEETVSKIIHQVIDALEYLHFRGICYFELQPDNVVMEDRHHPHIKLVDFGSAQFVPDGGAKVQVQGCTEYLAPEILKGEDVHTPADIWGVGVLTYILLSGFSPFVGDSEKETRDNVLYVRYHFDHLYKEVTPEATHFLMQLFKRTPQKRPTAEECQENKWLLPNEYMIKKREHAVFLSHGLKEFSERFHSIKAQATPHQLLNIFGKADR
ncbi:hypothetical protein JTE90_017107 [Oedothorax gibbosus]|uniref:Obscurin n=1 Tax=Oedothorax gibbosus TaxID=931172 RepID=A0AAV6UHG9_9ARAC|nr:hypothetical protein JTE90_017107 [Oedothorax gibbosus]